MTPKDQKSIPQDDQIEFYQIMGRTEEGDLCPFLSTLTENVRTKDGGLACLIYKDRPLICRSYPISSLLFSKTGENIQKYVRLHSSCDWVSRRIMEGQKQLIEPTPIYMVKRLDFGAMLRIQHGKYSNLENTTLWRYATHIGNKEDQHRLMPEGWINWGWF